MNTQPKPSNLGVTVSVDAGALDRVRTMVGATKREASKIIRFAINDTVQIAKTEAASHLAQVINLRVRDIKSQIRATGANYSNLYGRLRLRGAPIKLIKWIGVRQTKRGVSVQVLRYSGKPRTVIPHTMIATMPSGHRGVYWRKRIGADLAPRLPIQERYGPSIPAVFEGRSLPGVMARGRAKLQERLEHYMDTYLRKIGPFEAR